jgi:hypothetical protein
MSVSEVLPHMAKCVDDITLVRSMFTETNSHELGLHVMHGGRPVIGLPTMGSWVTYALGTENQNLPAYVVLDDPIALPVNGTQNWQSGFLPPLFQGTSFRAGHSPMLHLHPDYDEPRAITGLERDLISRLDRIHRKDRPGQPRLDARIANYELAARMQLSATDALDVDQEDAETLALYGIGEGETDSYGRRCLIARRLVERGVRFIQIFINNQIWDHHRELATNIPHACARTDKPAAGLLTDLKRRGLLEETLVLWGGEFGRPPTAELRKDTTWMTSGRNHNKNAMCVLMAGGGVQHGLTYGATDELGFAAVEDRVTVADWHATILHLLGLHHEELFFERNGLREKLTANHHPRVIDEILV